MPNEKHTERILLNYKHEINGNAYWVMVSRHGTHILSGSMKDTLEVSAMLYFHVDANAVPSKADFQPWVNQLNSPDPLKRFEAARVLASVAPRSWEDLLLTLADNWEFRTLVPLALHRLHTARSNAALAEFAGKTSPGTFEHWQAAAYIANDPCADEEL